MENVNDQTLSSVEKPASIRPRKKTFQIKPGHIKILILLFLILIFLISGFLVFIYYTRFRSSQFILNQSISELLESKSFSFQGNIKMYLSENNQEDLVNLEDGENSGNLSILYKPSEYELRFKGRYVTKDNKSSLLSNIDLDVQKSKLLNADLMLADGNIYLRPIDTVLKETYDIQSFFDKWIVINLGELNNKLRPQSADLKLKNPTYKDLLSLKQNFKNKNPFKVVEKLPADFINNKKIEHYKYLISQSDFQQILSDITATYLENENIKSYLDKVLVDPNKFSIGSGDVWIDAKSHTINKISQRLTFYNTGSTGTNLMLLVEINISDYNNSDTIETPATTVDFEEFLNSIK